MIEINGAGPAGLSSAIELLNNDYDVTVHEKDKQFCIKYNGSYQFIFIPGSIADGRLFLKSIIPNKILKKTFLTPIHSVKVSVYNETIEFHSLKPVWWAVKRGSMNDSLDTALLETVKNMDGEIKFGSTSNHPTIDATGGKIPAGIAREFIFDTDMDDVFHVILDKRLAPGGYAYLSVINKKATLCVAITKNMKEIINYSNNCLNIFKEIYDLKIENVHAQTNYVSFNILNTYVRNESLLVGEAAGLQDGLFGFGLWYAISSGQLAAHSLMYKMNYDALVKKIYYPLLKTGRVNRYFYELGESLLGNLFYKLVLNYSKGKNIKHLLKELTNPTPLKIWLYDFIG